MRAPLDCRVEERRELVRRSRLNGIDFVEVSEAEPGSGDRRRLTVCFLGKAPETPIAAGNIAVTGGRPVEIVDVRVERDPDPDRDDALVIILATPGDLSPYTLRLVCVDEYGRPSATPLPGLDPVYASIAFRFDAGCDIGLDCAPAPASCPPSTRRLPEISYLAKDYASFRQLILDRLALIMPEWTERSAADFGIVMAELLAYAGDSLSYFQDAVANEAYLDTARLRVSVRRHARLVDYPMHDGINARAWVALTTSQDWPLDPAITLFATRPASLDEAVHMTLLSEIDRLGEPVELFELVTPTPVWIYEARNELRIYTWGNKVCCLEQGATSATLALSSPPALSQAASNAASQAAPSYAADRRLLSRGDVILLEEVKGPRSGDVDDADPGHRHAVRLTDVREVRDPLTGEALLHVSWADEDALPFPLCLSAVGPDCELICDISVARGNVLLVDHGRRLDPEDLGTVRRQPCDTVCLGIGVKGDTPVLSLPFRPQLKRGPLVFAAPAAPDAPASSQLDRDPHQAVPAIAVHSLPPPSRTWEPRRDLFESEPEDDHFTVETEENGAATLRFGDGVNGSALMPGLAMNASYRVGGGVAGNLGAGAIAAVVFRDNLPSGLDLSVRNPIAARGGVAPESIERVKQLAPHAFRSRLERAVVPDDYADIAERHPGVQHAAAFLRWTGSWFEILLMVDPKGREAASPALLSEVTALLEPCRRMGHDLVVAGARRLPLTLRLRFCARRHYDPGRIRAALREVFGNRVLPNGRRGFFHPDQWTFGQSVATSAIYAAALAVEGIEHVEIVALSRLGLDVEDTTQWIDDGLLLVGPQEIVRLDNDLVHLENGTFDARSGDEP